MNSELLELLPDPLRMVEGLRDTGYQFNTAVADVVDNSVAAEATYIEIRLSMDFRGNVRLAIFDNGIGMDKDGLVNAMKYGSKPRPSPSSLGKFGLGLKTASTAFCRRLSVISRANKEESLMAATWDLDHIKSKNKWELIFGKPTEDQIKEFNEVLLNQRGTLVLWENVDRLLRAEKKAENAKSRKALSKYSESLRKHLSTVFQRFLDETDTRAKNVKIILDGEQVAAWDPFCIPNSTVLSEKNIEVEIDDHTKAEFQIKAYVLPRKEEFQDKEDAKAAAITNANQGIYIYRENRLIHGPDWLDMYSKEPHFSLLRVEFNFDYKLDEAFQIDIKKSQIILNEALYDFVLDFLTPPRREAEIVYRRGTRANTAKIAKTAHDSSNRNISTKEGDIKKPIIESIDQKTGEVKIVNDYGKTTLKLKITEASKPSELYIQPVESIDDGLLWEPVFIQGRCGIRINTSHPYYMKVYLPNLAEGVTIQGMDALLWGLCVAELNCVSDSTKEALNDLRFEVSRNLKKLVQDLPEPISET